MFIIVFSFFWCFVKKLVINSGDNQLIFDGKDIETPKSIDARISIESLSDHANISKFADKGVVVNFPNNGNLPGKALVRIKATKEVTNELKDKIYVYMYDEDSNMFYEIGNDVKKTSDGYYEYTVTHNSDFLMMNKKLDKKYVLENNPAGDKVVIFQKGNRVHLVLICLGLLLVVVALVVVIVLKKKKEEPKKKGKKKKKKEDDEEKD